MTMGQRLPASALELAASEWLRHHGYTVTGQRFTYRHSPTWKAMRRRRLKRQLGDVASDLLNHRSVSTVTEPPLAEAVDVRLVQPTTGNKA